MSSPLRGEEKSQSCQMLASKKEDEGLQHPLWIILSTSLPILYKRKPKCGKWLAEDHPVNPSCHGYGILWLPEFKIQLCHILALWTRMSLTIFLMIFPQVQVWKWKWSRSVVSDSLRPHGLQPSRFLCPWDFPGKSSGVGCHFLLQGIFLTQGLECTH